MRIVAPGAPRESKEEIGDGRRAQRQNCETCQQFEKSVQTLQDHAEFEHPMNRLFTH
jgi:hypothetical protein